MTRAQALAVIAVLASTLVAALDQTIVGTVMPTVIGELGGIDRYAWVFSAYLLLLTVSTPICGRLADMLGRKPVFLGGLAVFVASSALAGQSRTMEQLIAFRALQGLGAGAILPVGVTVIGDLFDLRMRARVQGLFSTVWISAALIGPAVGGVLAETLSWRWAFYVNVPIGLLAGALLAVGLREPRARPSGSFDRPGALVLALATGSLFLGLNGTQPLLLLPAAAALTVLFVTIERSARDPIIDLSLLRLPIVGPGLAVNAMAGVILFGVVTYVPPFVQGVQGARPVEVGAVVSGMSFGWSAGSITMGMILLRIGLRNAILGGIAFFLIGSGILVTLTRTTPLAVPTLATFATGLGTGFTATAILVGAQSAVAYRSRGIVTSLTLFTRSLGAAIGVGGLGTVLAISLGPRAAEAGPLLEPSARASLDPAVVLRMGDELAAGLHQVYLVILAIAVAVALLAWRLTASIPDRPDVGPDPVEADAAAVAGGVGAASTGS